MTPASLCAAALLVVAVPAFATGPGKPAGGTPTPAPATASGKPLKPVKPAARSAARDDAAPRGTKTAAAPSAPH
jgi:hypothetical protein